MLSSSLQYVVCINIVLYIAKKSFTVIPIV